MSQTIVSFTMNNEFDADLIRWVDSLPRRSKSRNIRLALRAQLASTGHGQISSMDIYQAVRDLERKLQAGAMLVKANTQDESSEPIDITNTLDNLGV
jgi:Arc/MetJ-type ribon-helix-helix transcriptional regulator